MTTDEDGLPTVLDNVLYLIAELEAALARNPRGWPAATVHSMQRRLGVLTLYLDLTKEDATPAHPGTPGG